MADYVTLIGAEQVQAAARQMQEAARIMQSSANQISDSFIRHEQFLRDVLTDLQEILKK